MDIKFTKGAKILGLEGQMLSVLYPETAPKSTLQPREARLAHHHCRYKASSPASQQSFISPDEPFLPFSTSEFSTCQLPRGIIFQLQVAVLR